MTKKIVHHGHCDCCAHYNEVKHIGVRPKGVFLFKLFKRTIKISLCQSCISMLFRGLHKDV